MGRAKPSRRRGRAPTRPKQRPLLTGTLRVDGRGSATVDTSEGTLFIPVGQTYEAMGGDTVQVRHIRGQHGTLSLGTVAHVLERHTLSFVATYVEDGPLRVLVPLDDRMLHDFLLDTASQAEPAVRHGQTVVACVHSYPTRRTPGVATIERVISDDEAESVAVEAIIASHGLAVGFPQDAADEAAGLACDVDEALRDPLRRDLRGRFVVTIDPADARDFDDAVSLEPRPEGGWVLGVHIADVSWYVRWGSPIDLAARERSTSVYLVDRVLPMLPEELSCRLCSLQPGEDRLAMTVELALDARGRVVSEAFYPSVIRSRASFSYDEVDAILEAPDAVSRSLDGVNLGEFFSALDRVRALRGALRRERGAIEFVSSEAKVVLDEYGRPTGVRLRRPTRATQAIEEAMLAANEAVARAVGCSGMPGAYRVHEAPSYDSLAALTGILAETGCLAPAAKTPFVMGDPHAVQGVLDAVGGRPEEELVSGLLLRAMKRAVYAPQDQGHYGLGAHSYCHFTSPIRRYPDLMMHRALKAALYRNLKASRRRELEASMEAICKHASTMERIAAAAAAESQAAKLAEYMAGFVGEDFWGTVVSVHPFGLFVRLEDTHAQGLLAVRELGDSWWSFDDKRSELVSEDGAQRYRLGQRVIVRVSGADALRGTIDFVLPPKGARLDRPPLDHRK